MRESGILYPISSLPSRFGIGCFSKEAYEFVDFLKKAKQSYWQILPLGPIGFGDSPYQPFSAFAGNPYYISLENLIEDGLLTWDEVEAFDFGQDLERVDYGALYNYRFQVLALAYERFKAQRQDNVDYFSFIKVERFWLEDYAIYMTLKQKNEGKSWVDWPKEERDRDPEAILNILETMSDEVEFIYFQQYMFFKQWTKLRTYANDNGVQIIGDIPFYVAMDSADAWSQPDTFKLDEVAGCPPDAFSATGQLWGNPIYNWKKMKASGYEWWMKRIARNYELYDVIRFDHFHGFCDYYSIPIDEKDALNGTMHPGPRMDFFKALKKKMGNVKVIAEDLGTITPEKEQLLIDSGFPGMKVLQFAFSKGQDSVYLPHHHIQNSVVYTGTHDNSTTRAWIEEINDADRMYVRQYIRSENSDYGGFVWDFIREAYRSVADLCIVPITDYIVKGNEARLNHPGVAQGNWQWRMLPNFLSDELCESIAQMTELYGRAPKKKSEEE